MDIILENITKKYGSQKAIDDVSFKVKTGEVLGFLGPNGAGKTTTMKIITCFLAPTQGSVTVGGYSIKTHPDEVKRHIGYLPENNPIYKEMPVIDYLRFAASLQNMNKTLINEKIYEMVHVCGLEGEKHKKIGELSKGYQQRVGLAQTLIHNPEVLVLDEPTSGLDPNQIAEIRDLIKKAGREKTVILSSHILAEVEATCDRILIINKGRIVADGTSDELRKRSKGDEMLKVTIEDGNRDEIIRALGKIESVGLVDPVKDNDAHSYEIQSKGGLSSRKEIFRMCADRGWTLTELTPIETKLEDVFRELTMN